MDDQRQLHTLLPSQVSYNLSSLWAFTRSLDVDRYSLRKKSIGTKGEDRTGLLKILDAADQDRKLTIQVFSFRTSLKHTPPESYTASSTRNVAKNGRIPTSIEAGREPDCQHDLDGSDLTVKKRETLSLIHISEPTRPY